MSGMLEKTRHGRAGRVGRNSRQPVRKVQVEASPATQHVEASSSTHHQVEASLAQYETTAQARHNGRSYKLIVLQL